VAGGGKMLNSRGNRIVRSVIDSVLCHRPSHLLFNSALHSVLNAVIDSALYSVLNAVIDSALYSDYLPIGLSMI
jgi:hypothetical protein